MIPQEKSAAVERALQETFGIGKPDELHTLPAGLSSDLLFRMVVAGETFLLLVMSQIDEIRNPARRFASMKMASDAGIAPEVLYINTENGISITRLITPQPLAIEEARTLVPRMLSRLHALAPFPNEFNYITADKSIQRFRTSNLIAESQVEPVFTRYKELAAFYPRLACDIVSCHCDLRLETITFDGKRLWLEDWKAAFLNDRYFDLAAAANHLVANEEEEWTYLHDYFGRPATSYESARFFLMRQIIHTMAAALYSLIGSQGKPIDYDQHLPSFAQFHQRLWTGESNLNDSVAKVSYGLLHWRELQQNLQGKRFQDAISIVATQNRQIAGMRLLLPVTE